MDHHCPWTANCVSYRTFPHFIRFLCYSVLAAVLMESHIWTRVYALWQKRHLPSYLGPSLSQLILLFVLVVINTITLVGLSLLLLRTLWSMALNTTTIESWEKDRHEALIRRAKRYGGVLDGPDGTQIRIVKQEFPYDIGIFSNLVQAMGTVNILLWPWPLAPSLPIDSGLSFEENGFEDTGTTWPPPDPDRMGRVMRIPDASQVTTKSLTLEDFRKRQLADLSRYDGQPDRPAVYDETGAPPTDNDHDQDYSDPRRSGDRIWRNEDGETLADYGVDEEADMQDEDDIPLAQLLRRRQQVKRDEDD